MDVCVRLLAAMRRADSPSKESYRLSTRCTISKLILSGSRPEGLTHPGGRRRRDLAHISINYELKGGRPWGHQMKTKCETRNRRGLSIQTLLQPAVSCVTLKMNISVCVGVKWRHSVTHS
jgi:hypothetical protein